ncbi:Protein of unknown function, partial [Gryllus bimaculatus]
PLALRHTFLTPRRPPARPPARRPLLHLLRFPPVPRPRSLPRAMHSSARAPSLLHSTMGSTRVRRFHRKIAGWATARPRPCHRLLYRLQHRLVHRLLDLLNLRRRFPNPTLPPSPPPPPPPPPAPAPAAASRRQRVAHCRAVSFGLQLRQRSSHKQPWRWSRF